MHNEIKTGLETHANNIRDIARLIDRGVLTGTTASNALLEERDLLRRVRGQPGDPQHHRADQPPG
jgi:hypothetical protein